MPSSKRMTVAVLAGGNSAERRISLISGRAVTTAARKLGYRVFRYDPARDLDKLIQDKKKIDVAFPILHGKWGEDGTLQGFLELLQIPYVGSDTLGSALAYRKIDAKRCYRQVKLPVARDFVALRSDEDVEKKIRKKIGLPCFVKPANEGSSYGASLVQKPAELLPALRRAWQFDIEVLVEEYLDGTEITVGVLDDPSTGSGQAKLQVLPIVEIRSKNTFFDLRSKYDPKLCEEICPAEIAPRIASRAQQLAKKAHRVLQLRHLSRTDFIIVGQRLYLLETNTLPGLTPTSLFPRMIRAQGLTFEDLVERLIGFALVK